MSSFNTKPIYIQVRDVYHNLIENAKIKVIAPNGDILFNEKSQSGYIVEVGDWVKQKIGRKGTGFDKGDIAANKKGIEYGNELRMRYGKII